MKRPRDLSIPVKLVLLAGTAVLCALIMSSTGIIFNDIQLIRRTMLEQLEVQARMMEFNSDGVLAFSDQDAARDLLHSMSLQPAVDVACLLDTSDELFAVYTKYPDMQLNLPTRLTSGSHMTDDGFIEIVTPVRSDDGSGEQVGTLYIRANTDNISQHTSTQVQFIVLVALGSLLVAVAVTAFLQTAISRPIVELAEAAQVITREEDYSIRVSPPSKDELGVLYRSFNQMLDALKSTHDELATQAEQLAKEVKVRKQTEADLFIAKEAAEASNRAKSEFLANMSHEIRTPLTGILGFTDVLLAGGDDGDAAKRMEYLSTIQTSGKHLLGVINDILDLSRIESGRMEFESEACNPDKIAEEVIRVLQVKAQEKSLRLAIRWEGRIPQIIFTDAARVRQALINLVGNSIKFTSAGSVELVGQLVEFEGRMQLQFDVIDTGIGIASDKLESVFAPFVQADTSVTRRFGGTGLGLAITRRIARELGGDLTATSVLGKGSTFSFRINTGNIAGIPLVTPITCAEPRIVKPATPIEQKRQFDGVRILLVEDGETNRKLIKLILERAGAQVATAENGLEGYEAAIKQPFDVILMDMQMPVLDGYSATTRLRDAGQTLPIVALTAHTMTGDREKCLEAGCTDYLTKPINADQMFATLASVLATTHGATTT